MRPKKKFFFHSISKELPLLSCIVPSKNYLSSNCNLKGDLANFGFPNLFEVTEQAEHQAFL